MKDNLIIAACGMFVLGILTAIFKGLVFQLNGVEYILHIGYTFK